MRPNPPYVIMQTMKLSTSVIRDVSLVGASGGCSLFLEEADASTIWVKDNKSNTLKGFYAEVGKRLSPASEASYASLLKETTTRMRENTTKHMLLPSQSTSRPPKISLLVYPIIRTQRKYINN